MLQSLRRVNHALEETVMGRTPSAAPFTAVLAVIRENTEDLRRLNNDLMMDRAVRECIAEGRADPKNPLVCVLTKPWHPEGRTVAQKWRDEAMEHLAVRGAP